MRTDKARINPRGGTVTERWYALARTHLAVIAKRERFQKRCKRCLKMRFNRKAGRMMPQYGCAGCAEMETFMEACRVFFADGNNGGSND